MVPGSTIDAATGCVILAKTRIPSPEPRKTARSCVEDWTRSSPSTKMNDARPGADPRGWRAGAGTVPIEHRLVADGHAFESRLEPVGQRQL